MKKLIKKLCNNSIVRYVFFGGCTTMVNLVSFFIFRKLGIKLHAANIISIILAILFAYVTNARYVFINSCRTFIDHIRCFVKFIGARLVTMAVEVGGVWFLADIMKIGEMKSKFITQFAVIILNYVFSRLFVFTGNKTKKQRS